MRFNRSFLIVSVLVIALIIIGGIVFVVSRKPVQTVPVEVSKDLGPKHETIGTSIEGRKIEAYTYGDGATKLLFVGGIHGGYEWNSVLLAYQFMDYVGANPTAIPKNISVTVIPSANPDGVFKVLGKEGRFAIADVPSVSKEVSAAGRFNARAVDLNRNFDCNWQATSTWQSKTVSAGTAPFSEPEALALKNFVLKNKPVVAVFWHSQANAVYASECNTGILPATLDVMNAYSVASGYKAVNSFDSYKVTGDAEGWLASIGIPAITVELQTHETVEWERNLAGSKGVLKYFADRVK